MVDVGISCREVERRMARLKISPEKVKAIFISHEHTDHISGVRVLSKKFRIPVYISTATLSNSGLNLEPDLVRPFQSGEPLNIGQLTITPFSKEHDAADPYSFVVEGNSIKIAVITDVGIACDNVKHYFKQCHAAFLEANYDATMLENGGYPIYLKNRIRGGKGHLSNMESLKLFLEHRPAFMNHLILSHLSKNNNTPELVEKLFSKHAGSTNIVVASRYRESDMYSISATQGIKATLGINIEKKKRKIQVPTSQLSLFQ